MGTMKRVIAKYRAYTNHLEALSEDTSLKPADRRKLKGYCSKWVIQNIFLAVLSFVIFFHLVWPFQRLMLLKPLLLIYGQ